MSRLSLLRTLGAFVCLFCVTCEGSGGAFPVVGISFRPSNTTCVAPPKPPSANVDYERAFPNLSFTQPVALRQRPGDGDRWYVVEKGGVIRVFDNDDGETTSSVFLDISGIEDFTTQGEAGLLSMAFHPDFPTTPQVFVTFNRFGSIASFEEVLARFTSSDMGATLDEESLTELVVVQKARASHNGGDLHFDSNDHLFWSLGDGGFQNPPFTNAQDTGNLLGSVVRLDPDGMDASCAKPYGIPAGNPFSGAACPTGNSDDRRLLYAWGLRNPWRFSFDSMTDDLWLGDVGQATFEEVNLIESGGNYGWPVKEGEACYPPPDTLTCADGGMSDPVFSYTHAQGIAITGGYLYRGDDIADLSGEDVYLFGDFGSGNIWALFDAYGTPQAQLLFAGTGIAISAFGEDAEGELYFADVVGGGIYRLIDSDEPAPGGFPMLLTETGCVDPESPLDPASGVIPYDINATFWSDGASKDRFFAIPDGTKITVNPDGDWVFPAGSVVMKHFFLNNRPFETRLLIRHDDGEWQGYSYEWREPATDADLLPSEGLETMVEGQDWLYPGRGNCITCHTGTETFTLGLKSQQINRNVDYGDVVANQQTTFEWIGLLSAHAVVEPMVDPYDETQNLTRRAKSWLDTNCSQCHQPGGPTGVDMDLRYETPLANMVICDEEAQTPLGTMRLDPGNPANSAIFLRPSDREDIQMPPLATYIVDEDGMALISEWITSITACP